MPRLRRASSFNRSFKKLSPENQAQVEEALRQLAANPRHPGLQVAKFKRRPGVWYCRATRSHRILFEFEPGVIVLLDVGPHDVLRR